MTIINAISPAINPKDLPHFTKSKNNPEQLPRHHHLNLCPEGRHIFNNSKYNILPPTPNSIEIKYTFVSI